MIPPIDFVRKVMVVTEDVFGPMRNSLYIELADGTWVNIYKEREMEKFVASLEKKRPQVAGTIRAALARVGMFCGEQMFDLEGE